MSFRINPFKILRIVGIIGRGENNPAKSNETSKGRGSNRRVEFRFVKKGQV